MLALDLVQAGFEAQAASDDSTTIEQVRALADNPDCIPCVIAAYGETEAASQLTSRLISLGLRCQVIVSISQPQRAEAEKKSQLLDWFGLISHPPAVEAICELLEQSQRVHQTTVVREVQGGSLRDENLGQIIERLLHHRDQPAPHLNAIIELKSKGRAGTVAIVNGEVVNATAEEDRGRHAFERMFCWNKGVWRLARRVHHGHISLRASTTSLLKLGHDYARKVDDARKAIPLLEGVCAVRWERVRPLPAAAEELFLRISTGVPLNEAMDGDGDDELEAFNALYSRIERGAVAIASPAGAAAAVSSPTSMAEPERASILASETVDVPQTFVEAAMPVSRAQPLARTHTYHAVPDDLRVDFASGLSQGSLPDGQSAVEETTEEPSVDTVDETTTLPRVSKEKSVSITADTLSAKPHGELENTATENEQALAHPPKTDEVSETAEVLPSSLPEYEDALEPEPSPEPAPVTPPPRQRIPRITSGWFGVNVNQDDDPRVADLSAVQKALVQAPVAAVVEPVVLSQSVAELPRAEPEDTSNADQAYSMWSHDFESEIDSQISELEQLSKVQQTGGIPRMVWVGALLLIAVVIGFLTWPSSSHYSPTQVVEREGATESPVVKTYRQAVALIDQENKPDKAEARVMLRRICDKPGVSPEAMLELAILEIDAGRFDAARLVLDRYIKSPQAKHKQKAVALRKHVFGEQETAHTTP